MHLLNKYESGDKNRRESYAEAKFRKTLSFSAFLVIFFAFAKSDIIATAIVILKPCGFSDILFAFQTRVANTTWTKSKYHCASNITRREANRTGVILR